jgi:hypothetical protein
MLEREILTTLRDALAKHIASYTRDATALKIPRFHDVNSCDIVVPGRCGVTCRMQLLCTNLQAMEQATL